MAREKERKRKRREKERERERLTECRCPLFIALNYQSICILAVSMTLLVNSWCARSGIYVESNRQWSVGGKSRFVTRCRRRARSRQDNKLLDLTYGSSIYYPFHNPYLKYLPAIALH
jgi:hypothetical protein